MSDLNQSSTPNRTHSLDMSAMGREQKHLDINAEVAALTVKGLRLKYGEKEALHGIDMIIPKQRVTAFIGPSGCGKSTLLRCFNRMNDLIDDCHISKRCGRGRPAPPGGHGISKA